MSENNKLPNVRALIEYRLKGRKVKEGEVVAKSDFANKGEWQNLAHMKPARVEETDAPVGAPKAAKADKGAMPGGN